MNPYKYSKKAQAAGKINYKVSNKKIPKVNTLFCIRCYKKAEHYHHFNYNFPLLVIPFCLKCHHKTHKENRIKEREKIKERNKNFFIT